MASREPITLTLAEVCALAERLRARATSVVLRDATSQQSDGILAAGALVHLVAELRALRGEIERAASSASEMAPLPGYVSNHVHCPGHRFSTSPRRDWPDATLSLGHPAN
jgi:hypothetical protein